MPPHEVPTNPVPEARFDDSVEPEVKWPVGRARHQAAEIGNEWDDTLSTDSKSNRSSNRAPAKKPAKVSSVAGIKAAGGAPARAKLNNAKAEEMLGCIIEIVRRQGLASFSLDNLAPQLGTSSRMLVYYFGSKDELLGRISRTIREDTVAQLESEPAGSITEAIERWWNHYLANPTDMQFLFHLTSRTFEEPEKFREFSNTAVGLWSSYFRRSLEGQVRSRAEARAIARLVLATVRGLQGDLLISADKTQVEGSLKIFKQLVQEHLAAAAKEARRASRSST
jgi:AcrR family transcriptional regulator